MSSDAEIPADQQPLPVRCRQDLKIEQTGTSQTPLWTVKDPVSERFFQLRQADFFVFQHLNGKTSVAEIQRQFFFSHAPRRLTEEQILTFVQRLFMQGLVHVEKYGLSSSVLNRAQRMQAAERGQRISGLLAIRFRGIDPDRLLDTLLPFVKWLFSPLCFLLSLLLLSGAFMIAVAEWEVMFRELPRFGTFIKSGQFLWFIGTMACIKIIHELAHAFACKRFGGECHELGIMLLAFTPCLYCNVSDAWMMKNRWHRIAISGAGIYVEIVTASLCMFLWYWSVPGIVHTISLYIVVISSISTVLLNGNPLLRYDGYYILSDLVGVPNLRARAQDYVSSWMTRFFLGIKPADPFRGQAVSKPFLGIYGVLSSIYVWFVVFAILWMLYQMVKPYGLQAAVVALGTLILLSRISGVVRRTFNSLKLRKHQGTLKMKRIVISSIITVLCVCGVLLLKFPRRLEAPCILEAEKTESIYITSPGRVEFVNLKAGQQVQQGDVLAILTNRELERDVLKLNGKVDQQQKRIDLLIQRQVNDKNAAAELPSARAALRDDQLQLQDRQSDMERLTLKAPFSGILLPGTPLPSSSQQTPELLSQGAIIEMHNEGAWLEVGSVLCRIADPSRQTAILYFDQADAVLLTQSQPARLVVSQSNGHGMSGEVLSVSAEPLVTVPPILMREELIPFEADGSGKLRPAQPIHEVRVLLDQRHPDLMMGQIGTGVIHLKSETVLSSLVRILRQTLTFDL